MSNQSKNPQNNSYEKRKDVDVNENSKRSLTTQRLGIVDSKEKDMTGFILNQKDIHSAVYKLLIAVGIDKDDVKYVKVGTDKTGELRIVAAISANSFARKRKPQSFLSLNGGRNDSEIPRWFFDAMYNKTYHGKNKAHHMEYRRVQHKGKPCIIFEIDPEIFIAFAYNIDFQDDGYAVSTIDLSLTGVSKKEYDKQKNNLRSVNLNPCIIMVRFLRSEKMLENAYKTMVEDFKNNVDIDLKTFKNIVENAISPNPFHPNQVDEYYKAVYKQTKKHKKN